MNVGIIGAGLQGRRRAQAITRSVSSGQMGTLVATVDTDMERAEKLVAEFGGRVAGDWRELVASDDIDVIVLCTPPDLHAVIANSAMENGKHVLCEKPLARTVEEARSMVETGAHHGVVLNCGFNLRHHPGVSQVKRWADEGRIGRLMSVRCRYGIGGRDGYEREWRTDPEISGGGQIMDQGVHAFDLARWFLDDFDTVVGLVETHFWDIAPAEDNGYCLLRTEDHRVASIHVSWTQWKPLFSLEVHGTDGYAIVEGLGGAYGLERVTLGRRDFTAPFEEEIIEYRGDDRSWEAEWEAFTRVINDAAGAPGNGSDGLRAVEIAEAVYESARTGRVVGLDKLTRP